MLSTRIFIALAIIGVLLAGCSKSSPVAGASNTITAEEATKRQQRRLTHIDELPVPAEVKAQLKQKAIANPITVANPNPAE
jgi:hypothetical protein